MGLVNKLKNILFEEEEVEIPVLEKKEKKEVFTPSVATQTVVREEKENNYQDFYRKEIPEKEEQQVSKPVEVERKTYTENTNVETRMTPKEPSFNFPDFDEEEFESFLPRRTTNVIEHERKKEMKKKDYKPTAKKEVVQETKTKFRPSPIISPVYGILDKNYTPDEITSRTDNDMPKPLDVDSVRKKAFGTLELDEKFEPENVVNDGRFEDNILEERLEKARTIDELLKDSSDDVIDVRDDIIELPDELDKTIDSLNSKKEEVIDPVKEDDSLENDLFDLIDSMYENREDGE